MTRETKVGLVVATTFLSLVGVVVASKLRRTDDPDVPIARPGFEESGAPGAPASPPTDPVGPAPQSNPNGTAGKPASNGGAPPTAGGLPPVASDAPKPGQPPTPPDPLVTKDGLPLVPAIAPQPVNQPASVPMPLTEVKPSAAGLPPAGLPPTGLPPAGLPSAGLPPAGLPPVETDPLLLAPARAVEPKKFPAPGVPSVPPADPLLVSPPGGKEEILPRAPLGAKPTETPLPLPAEKGPFTEPVQLPGPLAAEPPKGKPEPMPAVPPAPDPIQPKIDGKPSVPMPPEKGVEPVGPPPLAPGVGVPPVAPMPTPKSPSIGTIGTIGNPAIDVPSTPSVTPSVPGNPALAPGLAIAPTGNKALPPVTSHADETRYTQPGDTSFDELSRKYYGTPNYGRALLEYNRKHPLAKTNLMQDPPLLQPNQPIYYPDKGILEIKYNHLIQSGTAAAPVSVLPTVKISTPMPYAGPGNVLAPNPPTADATTDFRVAQPQFIFDIARQQLGDGSHWTEILRLNPALHTDQPIPAGTVLRLPKLR